MKEHYVGKVKLSWTNRYCNMQYLEAVNGKNLEVKHFVALRYFPEHDSYLLTYTDKHKNKAQNMSNFGHDFEMVGNLQDCMKTVAEWSSLNFNIS